MEDNFRSYLHMCVLEGRRYMSAFEDKHTNVYPKWGVKREKLKFVFLEAFLKPSTFMSFIIHKILLYSLSHFYLHYSHLMQMLPFLYFINTINKSKWLWAFQVYSLVRLWDAHMRYHGILILETWKLINVEWKLSGVI